MSGSRFVSSMCVALALCVALQGCRQEERRKKALDKPGDLILDLGEGVKMRFVPIDALDLFVGRYEVSNMEYRRFKPGHSSGKYKKQTLDKDDQPVVNVSWQDAQEFCAWLNSAKEVIGDKKHCFRLPSAEEWEAYAGCGQTRDFPWGNDWPPPGNWNYYGAENPSPGAKLGSDDGFRVSCPVGKSGANEWRLFGVGGNVWEWCQDAGDVEGKARVLRGASWVDCHPVFLKIQRSKMYPPDYRAVNMGFRVVVDVSDLTPEEKEKFEARRKEQEAREQAGIAAAQAEKARKEAEAARIAAQLKEDAERAKQENKAKAQAGIRNALKEKDFVVVSARLSQYEKDFGKDDFYEESFSTIKSTRVIRLSDSVVLEFVRNPGLGCWTGKYEVTNKQYKEFKPEHDSGSFREYSLNEDDQPVVNVSWNDAKAFCQWLNSEFDDRLNAGQEFRLPTEQEWETFAACGQTRDFPWGNDWPPPYGNFGAIEDYDDGFPVSCPVDESGSNDWNLYGVAGNVWEWCGGWLDAAQTYRVIRGGAWNLARADALRVTNRSGDVPDQKNSYIGFRVVMGQNLGAAE